MLPESNFRRDTRPSGGIGHRQEPFFFELLRNLARNDPKEVMELRATARSYQQMNMIILDRELLNLNVETSGVFLNELVDQIKAERLP